MTGGEPPQIHGERTLVTTLVEKPAQVAHLAVLVHWCMMADAALRDDTLKERQELRARCAQGLEELVQTLRSRDLLPEMRRRIAQVATERLCLAQ